MQPNLEKAQSLLRSGHYKKALKEAKALMRRMPRSPDPHNVAGMALSALGQHTEAARSFNKAMQIAPEFDSARRNLAQALILAESLDKAKQVLRALLRKSASDEGSWYLLARCEFTEGNLREADDAISRAIDLAPGAARNWALRATIREKQGDLNGSLSDFEAALGVDPNNVDALVNMSMPLARQLRTTEALDAVSKAVTLAPKHLGARQRLALQFVEAGKEDEAIEAFRAVLSLDPSNGLAMENLAQLQSAEQNRELKRLVQSALRNARKKTEDRASLFFALANIARKERDVNTEIDALAKANAEMSALLPYDGSNELDLSQRIRSMFPREIALPVKHTALPNPIYVVGLPRSGTTLAEAVLGAHPNVAPLGERAAAGILLKDTIENNQEFDSAAQKSFREGDAGMLPQLPFDTAAYVDKMPENYRLVGFLRLAYPSACIINITRDPRDIALSMWRGHFSGTALNYTYSLRAMAHKFNIYAEMMRHWHWVLPGQILNVRYEDLVSDMLRVSKLMAKHCGIDWTGEMLNPHLAAEQVMTLSSSQVRQPVHAKSIGGWKRYQDVLQPFVNELDMRLWHEEMSNE